ncbi:MAG: septum formation initiator family protein [Gemmatimonadaceae bacterium]|nr:septum formation initiator family protein [Gemmatimonadaceae bacterium]
MARARTTVWARWLPRLAWGAVAMGAGAFAVWGGEFSVLDLRAKRAEAAVLRARLVAAKATRDSLLAVLDSVKRHPAVIERIAREQHGLVRGDREFVYWAPVDSSADSVPGR